AKVFNIRPDFQIISIFGGCKCDIIDNKKMTGTCRYPGIAKNTYIDKIAGCILVLLVFFLLHCSLFAQDDRTDSLRDVLKTQKDDTNRVYTLIRLSAAISTREPEKAIQYAQTAIKLSKKLDFPRGSGMAYERIGIVHINHSNFQQAIDNLLLGIRYYETVSALDDLARVYNQVGIVYYYIADYDKSLNYYLKSLQDYEELNDKRGIASAYNNIGIIYNIQENNQKALEYHFKSLGLNKEIGNSHGIASSYNNIGEIYREQGNTSTDPKTKSEKYDKALEHYMKSLEMKKEEGDTLSLSAAYGNIGLIYQSMGEYDKALENHLTGLELKEKTGDKFSLGESYSGLGSFYLLVRDYRHAEEYYRKALDISEEIGALEIYKDAAAGLSNTYAAQKQFEKAYNYEIIFKNISDSIFRKEGLKKITQVEMQYKFDKQQKQQEFEQKKREIAQRANLKRQKIINYSLFIGLVLLSLLAFVIFRSYREKKRTAKQLEEQKLRITEEKQKSDNLLLNILPKRTADELKKYGRATSKRFEKVSVMFADFVGFTRLCEDLNPLELIYELDYYFSEFDSIIEKYPIEKVKTIGDAYMCAGGIPYRNDTNPIDVVLAGLEIQRFMNQINADKRAENKPEWRLRLGINTGEVVTGVVGTIKFAYDIWGDTVNVASRMEETGEPGKVNISGATYELIKEYFVCNYRGKIEAKNKGEIDMYFVESIKPEYSIDGEGLYPSGKLNYILDEMRNA
ncbi:MAG: tetratricopeptide repeat protein, partial [Bacteroidetes bacterium]|nr:tetratricopeptide repeat protein [Bacteroidota bacterium]